LAATAATSTTRFPEGVLIRPSPRSWAEAHRVLRRQWVP
jgi:hypothetical protein